MVSRMSEIGSVFFDAPINKGRSGGIDAMRAVFALWVIIAHLVPRTYKLQGPNAIPGWLYYFTDTIIDRLTQASNEVNPAVLGFIVLSGYCIHRNGLRSDHPAGATANFTIRRCFRILPVYWMACLLPLLTLPVAANLSMAATVAVNGAAAIDPACLVAKMLSLPAVIPSFHPDGCSSAGNGPLLTVTFEIWLYAVYAAVFTLFANRWRDRTITTIASGCFLLSIAIASLSTRYAVLYNWWQNSSVLGFLPYWWLGAALVIPSLQQWTKRYFVLISGCWIGLTVVILLGGEFGSAIAELRKVFFSLGIGAIIARIESANVGESNPLSSLGRAGYSLYAFHSPLLLPLVIAGFFWPLTLALIVAFGATTYFIVERPMIALGKWLARNQTSRLRASVVDIS
jgi:peptidoglycan/LPS O-acetylase OafA/YrhL